jgi:hypothetical protein
MAARCGLRLLKMMKDTVMLHASVRAVGEVTSKTEPRTKEAVAPF